VTRRRIEAMAAAIIQRGEWQLNAPAGMHQLEQAPYGFVLVVSLCVSRRSSRPFTVLHTGWLRFPYSQGVVTTSTKPRM